MRIFAETPKRTQQAAAAKTLTPVRANFKQNRDLNSTLHVRRAMGDEAVQPLLGAQTRVARGDLDTAESARFAHDFSRVPARAVETASGSAAAVNFQAYTAARIPLAGSYQEDSIRQPPAAPATPAPAPAPAPAGTGDCDTPRRMVSVKSGGFHGGLALSNYFPNLVGRGAWGSAATAGPFNSGSRVGSSIQLYGLVPAPCQPSQYSFEQTYQDTRIIRNGVHGPEEGQVVDDFARSGQDQSRAPFRQLFLDTAGAEGLAISMGDPPSETYGPTDNLEWDCSYVTSLVGPSGRVSASWSTSVRVANGTVSRNTLS